MRESIIIMPTKGSFKENKVLVDHGMWLEVDVSTRKHPNAVMKIDKAEWEKFKKMYGNRVFASYTRGGLYALCSVRRKTLYVHRGIYDTEMSDIDHINRDGLDNRIANLRGCRHSENMANRPMTVLNTSGCSGVGWHTRRKKWQAKLTIRGKQIYLGLFTCIDDAIKARKAAEAEHFGQFAHGAN